MGAQLHRILGVYALARAAGAFYLHSPIKALKFAGVSTRDEPSAVRNLVDRAGVIFPLPTDGWAAAHAQEAVAHQILDARIAKMAPVAGTDARPALFKICMPHRHLDLSTELWRPVAPAVNLARGEAAGPLRVALHVRRGELHFVDSDRMLPNEYYIAIAERLRVLLTSASLPYRFELYTEAVSAPTTIARERFFDPARASDQVLRPEHDRLDEFNVLAPLDRFVNLDAIETLQRLATADVLVTSRSSFSFVAGVLAPEKLVIYAPFWHSPMPGWLTTTGSGKFEERAARRHLQELAARRSMS